MKKISTYHNRTTLVEFLRHKDTGFPKKTRRSVMIRNKRPLLSFVQEPSSSRSSDIEPS